MAEDYEKLFEALAIVRMSAANAFTFQAASNATKAIRALIKERDKQAMELSEARQMVIRRTLEVAKFQEALRFYANPEVYKPHPHGPAFDQRDINFCARAALGEHAKMTHEPVFIILGGNPIMVDTPTDLSCAAFVKELLLIEGYDPARDWELKDAEGNVLDQSKKFSDFYKSNKTFYLSLSAGVGS